MRGLTFAVVGLLVSAATAYAQHEHARSPYADAPTSEIRSLSVEELEGLRTGAGLGFARAAELNSYPGPRHVLDLADELNLSADQRARVAEVFQTMSDAAVRLGAEIIEAERTLGRRFEHRHIDSATLKELLAELGHLYGELRYVHLDAHLAVGGILDPEQIAEYDKLRGYAEPQEGGGD